MKKKVTHYPLYCVSCGRAHEPAETVWCACGRRYELKGGSGDWQVVSSGWTPDDLFVPGGGLWTEEVDMGCTDLIGSGGVEDRPG